MSDLSGKTIAVPAGPLQDCDSRALDTILGYYNIASAGVKRIFLPISEIGPAIHEHRVAAALAVFFRTVLAARAATSVATIYSDPCQVKPDVNEQEDGRDNYCYPAVMKPNVTTNSCHGRALWPAPGVPDSACQKWRSLLHARWMLGNNPLTLIAGNKNRSRRWWNPSAPTTLTAV
jgi:hypothetical protein